MTRTMQKYYNNSVGYTISKATAMLVKKRPLNILKNQLAQVRRQLTSSTLSKR